jgi:hypothetical protein
MQELLGVDRICRVNCKIYYRHDDHFYLVGGNSYSGIHTDPNGYPINVNDEYVWVAQKEEMAKYRKKYAFFSECGLLKSPKAIIFNAISTKNISVKYISD